MIPATLHQNIVWRRKTALHRYNQRECTQLIFVVIIL